ncbi:MAG TPA: hypothetical protein VFN09_05335 [Rhodanobacteraceae bacterium]|nr:hypothetical protein [Rhodanobacteraceae bacterium]
MNSNTATVAPTHSLRASLRAIVPWLLLLPAFSVSATTQVIKVGSGSGCDVASVEEALQATAVSTADTVDIVVANQFDGSLGFSYQSRNTELGFVQPIVAEVSITGGFAHCGDANPVAGQVSTLTYAQPVTDKLHTLLRIINADTNPRFSLNLTNLVLQGANDPPSNSASPLDGGAIKVMGNAAVSLKNVRITGFHALHGGGVWLESGASDRMLQPALVLSKGSRIDSNTASAGGGVYSESGHVSLFAASVDHNTAVGNGGGLWLSDDGSFTPSLLYYNFALLSDDSSSIANNRAGSGSYVSTTGFGGAIYSHEAHVAFQPWIEVVVPAFGGSALAPAGVLAEPDPPHFNTLLSNNHAFTGGAIYAEGESVDTSGDKRTRLYLQDTLLSGNTSDGFGGAIYSVGQVDWSIASSQGQCQLFLILAFVPSPCSLMVNNTAGAADGAGDVARGGAIYITNARADGLDRGSVTVTGTWFVGNADPNGLASVAAAAGSSDLIFHRNIITDNPADDLDASSNIAPSAFIYADTNPARSVDFRYNTIKVQPNAAAGDDPTRLFNIKSGTLDATGSILWGSVDRGHPAHFVWFHSGGAIFRHYGCLVVRTNDSGIADITDTDGIPLLAGYAPNLAGDFTPKPWSVAIDFGEEPVDCNSFDPGPDAYGRTAYDVPGIGNAGYTLDLGAVEQNDVIFYHNFGYGPDN